ncbi:MAG TPA: hypothetical protein VIY86_12590, partial [Pirellulaceae bacterium]
MAQPSDRSFSSVALRTMGWPVLLGTIAACGFYFLIHNKVIESPLVERYFAGHPVEYVEGGLFFIGLAALILKLLSVAGQLGGLGDIQLPQRPEGG